VNTDSAPTATIFLAPSIPTTLSSFIQSHFENITLILNEHTHQSMSLSYKRSPASTGLTSSFLRFCPPCSTLLSARLILKADFFDFGGACDGESDKDEKDVRVEVEGWEEEEEGDGIGCETAEWLQNGLCSSVEEVGMRGKGTRMKVELELDS
jgi:hypothetical protein